jgi:hypothetical protein
MYSVIMQLAKEYLAANGRITSGIASNLVRCSIPDQILKKMKGSPRRRCPSHWGSIIMCRLEIACRIKTPTYRKAIENGKRCIYLIDMPSRAEGGVSQSKLDV